MYSPYPTHSQGLLGVRWGLRMPRAQGRPKRSLLPSRASLTPWLSACWPGSGESKPSQVVGCYATPPAKDHTLVLIFSLMTLYTHGLSVHPQGFLVHSLVFLVSGAVPLSTGANMGMKPSDEEFSSQRQAGESAFWLWEKETPNWFFGHDHFPMPWRCRITGMSSDWPDFCSGSDNGLLELLAATTPYWHNSKPHFIY